MEEENPMNSARLTAVLPKFVEQLERCHDGQVRPLTVNDLRLGIRSERMSEISDWPNHVLDVMEVHAAQFGSNAPLECVLNLSSDCDQAAAAAPVSSICSPSPFAWT
jgi:hypothetical protein